MVTINSSIFEHCLYALEERVARETYKSPGDNRIFIQEFYDHYSIQYADRDLRPLWELSPREAGSFLWYISSLRPILGAMP